MNNDIKIDELVWKPSTTIEEDGFKKLDDDMFLARTGSKFTLGISEKRNLVIKKELKLSEAQKLIEKFDLVDTPSVFPNNSTYRDKESTQLVDELLRQVR